MPTATCTAKIPKMSLIPNDESFKEKLLFKQLCSCDCKSDLNGFIRWPRNSGTIQTTRSMKHKGMKHKGQYSKKEKK